MTLSAETGMVGRLRDGRQHARDAFPGILAAITIAMAATFLSEHYGGPVMLFALLLGIAFQFLSEEGRCVAGIEIASRNILRIGVALLGARITTEQILSLGWVPMLSIIAAIALTILLGGLVGRAMGLGGRFGVLSGGAVAICGASAALAISSVLPKDKKLEQDTIFTVISVTTLSTIAMIIYPLIVAFFEFDHVKAGFFLGGTIHDVAQVVGAGYSVSEETGDLATFTKLLRVAMLLPVVFALALMFRGPKEPGQTRKVPFQGFLFAFAALVAINSMGMIPEPAQLVMVDASRWCLVTAIAALGMKTSLKSLATVGLRPIALIVGQTIFLALLILGVIMFMI